jgi:tRNA nucleotidyltransferase/poly(A) polymerase
MNINIPEKVKKITNELTEAGFEAYIVGGCVRDAILGVEPSDWDICTSAKPADIKKCFAAYKTVDTGIKHGTVTVIIDHEPFEVTTYRIDGLYTDGRHPDSVTFTSEIKDDLSRRDFTINAMAYNRFAGLVDPFGGMADLANRAIKCVGEPKARFDEDALRILRALRFASVLGFEIEKETDMSVRKFSKLVQFVSKERVNVEFSKLLLGDHAKRILTDYRDEMMEATGLELPMESMLGKMDTMPKDLPARLALLFPANVMSCLKVLKYDNATIRKAVAIDELTAHPLPTDETAVKRMLKKGGPEAVRGAFAVCEAFYVDTSEATAMLDHILETGECYSLEQLAVSGEDLMDAGVAEGPQLGAKLNELLDAVIDGKVENDVESLMRFCK